MKVGRELWEQHVATARLDGGTTADYAKRHTISLSSLYYWQSKLRMLSVTGAVHQTDKFVALRVADSVSAPRSPSCSLVFACGMRLEMPVLPAPEWLAALAYAAAQGTR